MSSCPKIHNDLDEESQNYHGDKREEELEHAARSDFGLNIIALLLR